MWTYNHTDELMHYGILGMKWGVRRSDAQLARARKSSDDYHEDYKNAHSAKSVKNMSNKELQERNNRLNMEKQYAQLTKKESKGKAFITNAFAVATTAATVAKIYSTIKKFGKSDLAKDASNATNKALDKIGNAVVKIGSFGQLH